jgi:hypothetical protein
MLESVFPMPQFVIERDVPGIHELSEAEIREISLNKLYCVYLAPDEASVREHARRGGFPANRVAAVRRLIDPVNYQ